MPSKKEIKEDTPKKRIGMKLFNASENPEAIRLLYEAYRKSFAPPTE